MGLRFVLIMGDEKLFTYYDVLGVRKDAGQETIHDAYRTMAKKLHPDMGGSATSMNMLTHAYSVLSNPEKRAKYDASLKEPVKEAPRHTEKQPSAEDLLDQERALVSEVRRGAVKGILIGLGLFILGAVITGATYGSASPGGTYVLAWGPMLFGIIYFIRGLFNVLSPYSVLRKAFDSAGYKHKFYLEKSGQPARAIFTIIGIVIGGVILLSIIASASSGSSSSTSTDSNYTTPSGLSSESASLKSQYDACIETFKSIESDLDYINSQMDQYKASGQNAAYNNLVPQQNQLTRDYNAKYYECETYRTSYNNSLSN